MMPGRLKAAFGYRGNAMALPVANLHEALPFYQQVLGFREIFRADVPPAATLARDDVQIGLVEDGGDPTQDGCAFHVEGLAALAAEFKTNGLENAPVEFSIERHDEVSWRVFYVIAPDGLCYWFGERVEEPPPKLSPR